MVLLLFFMAIRFLFGNNQAGLVRRLLCFCVFSTGVAPHNNPSVFRLVSLCLFESL